MPVNAQLNSPASRPRRARPAAGWPLSGFAAPAIEPSTAVIALFANTGPTSPTVAAVPRRLASEWAGSEWNGWIRWMSTYTTHEIGDQLTFGSH